MREGITFADLDRNSTKRDEVRDLVADYILANLPAEESVKLLSLPAEWRFETRLIAAAPGRRMAFVGVERDETSYENSLLHVPERGEVRREGDYYCVSNKIHDFMMCHMELADFVSHLKRYGTEQLNCGWLDFCGNLGEPVMEALKESRRAFRENSPVAVTIMGKREQFFEELGANSPESRDLARTAIIEEFGFKVEKAHKHIGHQRAPMTTYFCKAM